MADFRKEMTSADLLDHTKPLAYEDLVALGQLQGEEKKNQ